MRTTLPLAALAAALSMSGCYLPYYASLFNRPAAAAPNAPPATAPAAQADAPPPAPQTPSRWQGATAVRLVNRSAVPVCFVYMAPEREQELGGDWLGASETVAVGATRAFGVQPAKYRVRLEGCDGAVVLDQTGLDFLAPRELVLLDVDEQAPAASAERVVVRTSARPRPAAAPAYVARDTGYGGATSSYGSGPSSFERDDPAPRGGGGASTYSLTLHNGCSRNVQLFVGRGNPPFGSGTNTSLGANNTRSFSGVVGGDTIWIVDASGRGVSSLQPPPGSSRVEITAGCTGFGRY